MIRAQILDNWTTNEQGTRQMNLSYLNDHGANLFTSLTDKTEQPSENIPTDPNLLVVEVTCTEDQLAAIEGHKDYGEAAVLWVGEMDNEKLRDGILDLKWRKKLRSRLAKAKIPNIEIEKIIGNNVGENARRGIANDLISQLKALPKSPPVPVVLGMPLYTSNFVGNIFKKLKKYLP